MRVAITHPYSWPDVRRGAERMVVETSRSLAARGHDVTVLTSGGAASLTSEGGVRTVRYRRFFPVDGRHERWFGWRITPALATGRFDVVHSLMPWDAVAAIRTARLARHRTVYEELGNPVREKVERRQDRRARERVIREVDVFAGMSEFSRGWLERDWGRKGVVVPGGVRCAEFAPERRHDRPTVLFSGALDRPEKNVRQLLEAVAVLARRRPDVELRLSGPGDARPLLAAAPEATRRRTRLLPLGHPEDLAHEYARAWVTCLPTEWDSFGLVVVESLASGTPVVSGPAGAPPEVISPEVGVVAPALDPLSLADALDRGLALAEAPGTVEACQAVARRYDWDDAIAPLLEDLYGRTDRL
ncbi:MAG: glycosyltransferase family 4 protein [Acidimicrobiia bacterium]